MELSIVKIGNSKGLRLSKTILEKYDIKDTVEVTLEKDHIVLKPKQNQDKDGIKHSRKCMIVVRTSFYCQMYFKTRPLTNGNNSIPDCIS